MGYASVIEVDLILAQSLTSARPDGSSNSGKITLINIGNIRDPNRIPTEVVEYYISLADTQIDGILSQQYYVPFSKCVHGQWDLEAPINEYNQTVEVSDATNLVPGDEVIIRDDSTGLEETHVVETIIDQYSFTVVDDIESTFEIGNTRVIRVGFPPPINQISARYAASFIYDKYFASQNAPNVSDYGNKMRDVAMGQLNDVLNGKVILKEPCARRIGDRFGNAYLDSAYAHRKPVDGYHTQDRNMSKL